MKLSPLIGYISVLIPMGKIKSFMEQKVVERNYFPILL